MQFCAQHRFGKLSYLYDANAQFNVVRWKSSQYFGGGSMDETKEMLKHWQIKEGDVVVDAGAHIGSWTLPALAQGAARVLCYEPQEQSVEILKNNIALNRWDSKCILVQKALWDKSDVVLPYYWPISISLEFSKTGWIVSRTEGEVLTTTLDDSVKEEGLEKLDWLKIDVDGSEVFLLDGAQQTIRQFKPTILIAKHYDILESIYGKDVDLKEHLPLAPTSEIKTEGGHFVWKF